MRCKSVIYIFPWTHVYSVYILLQMTFRILELEYSIQAKVSENGSVLDNITVWLKGKTYQQAIE